MAVFTVTQCRTAATCPRLFWFGLQGGQTFFWDERATPTLGRLFHEAMEGLIHAAREWERKHGSSDICIEDVLEDILYDAALHPLLERHAAVTPQSGEALLNLWTSLQEALDVIRQLLAAARTKVPAAQVVEQTLLQGEFDLSVPARHGGGPGLKGRLDAVVFDHVRGLPVILEYKTVARSFRDADIMQLMLYRWLLQKTRGITAAPVLLYFTPQVEEVSVDDATLSSNSPEVFLRTMASWARWGADEGLGPLPATRDGELCAICPHAEPCADMFTPGESRPGRRVGLRRLLEREEPGRGVLAIPLGLDEAGVCRWFDLATSHLLVGGGHGSGKSSFLLSIIASLAWRHDASRLRFRLYDPKGTTFENLSRSPYVEGDVCTDADRALAVLEDLVEEKTRRETANEKLPRLIAVVDDYGELALGFTPDERAAFEGSIEHLGRGGREVGIHVVVAVHRPYPRVVSPTLRSSLASKVAFRVGSEAESRLLLDRGGAELLAAEGELLPHVGSALRAPYVSPEEAARLLGG